MGKPDEALSRYLPEVEAGLRWRPNKAPEQRTFAQLTFTVPIELEEIFGLRGTRLA